MRKRSSYRPKGVRLDVMSWVLQGMQPISAIDDAATTLKIKNHLAMESLRTGNGNRDDVDVVVAALNMTEALARLRIGNEFAVQIRSAQDSMFDMARRGVERGDRFVFTGPELVAINLGMEIHDAQLDACTVAELEKALAMVEHEIRHKRARRI